MKMKFANQDMCLRDLVSVAQDSSHVRLAMKKGKWYNALMGMSHYFRDMGKARGHCKLVRKNAHLEERDLTAHYTCESAALYMEYNGLMMAESVKKMNAEKFFYHAAQAYAGAWGMKKKCRTMKQGWYAITRGEVTLAKKIIQRMGGNFNRCMSGSQTGFENYQGFFRNYMTMNRRGMAKYFNKCYDYESNMKQICFHKSYPTKASYANWNQCVAFGMDYLANDRAFGMEYWGKKKSNWTKLGKLLGKMTVDKLGGDMACTRNAHYNKVYTVNKA